MIPRRAPMNRRALLRGVGTAMALPLLDSMVGSARAAEADQLPKRLQIFYMPNGMIMTSFTPKTTGAGYEMSPTLQPLAAFRDRFTVITGLSQPKKGDAPPHARNCAGFLTGAEVKHTDGFDFRAGMSMDQIVARQFGQSTQLASLELGLEPPSLNGTCEVSASCAYTNTLSWRDPTTPMPVIVNPRDVFERMFGDSDGVDPKSRLAQLKRQASILDFVMDDAATMSRSLGAGDRHKLNQYMEAVRDVERRIQKAEQGGQGAVSTDFARPSGIPDTFEAHMRVMVDLQVLAMQADLTRVSSFMLGREISNRAYPEIGVADAHHMLSHHGNDPEKIAKLVKINQLHMEQFAYYLKRMSETKDGEGSLLDRTLVMAGAAMGNPNEHDSDDLPLMIAGGLTKGGRHIAAPKGTAISNLLVTVMDTLGVRHDAIGDSTGSLSQLHA